MENQAPQETQQATSSTLLTPKPATLPTKDKKPKALGVPDIKALPGKKGKNKNKLLIGLGLGVVAIVVLVLAVRLIGSANSHTTPSNDPRLKPTPTLIPRPTISESVQGKPSAYANDPQILELEAAIKSLGAQIEADNLAEPEIQPPLLEGGIKF